MELDGLRFEKFTDYPKSSSHALQRQLRKEGTRFCGDCQQIKGLAEFTKRTHGWQSYCKGCMSKRGSKYQKANKEKVSAYQKQRYQTLKNNKLK